MATSPEWAVLRVASIGDSLSAPNRFGASWVQRACAQTGAEAVAVEAVAGEPVATIARRLDRVLATRPNVLVVLAGTNDVVHRRTVRPALRLFRLARTTRAAGVRPVLATIPPHDDLPFDLRVSRWAFNVQVRLVARATRASLVDLSAPLGDRHGWLSRFSDDRRHPNAAGVDAMAAALVPVLRRASRPSSSRQ